MVGANKYRKKFSHPLMKKNVLTCFSDRTQCHSISPVNICVGTTKDRDNKKIFAPGVIIKKVIV